VLQGFHRGGYYCYPLLNDLKATIDESASTKIIKMITREEIKHFQEIGSKEIVLDTNKNPSTRPGFQYPKYVIDLEKKQIHLIDKSIIKK